MRYSDLREGVEVFGRSLGRVMCVICVCAPAVIANHIIKGSASDWDLLIFWVGMGVSIWWLCGAFAMFGEQKRHMRESLEMTLRNIQDAQKNKK
jgi:hypothetical protein